MLSSLGAGEILLVLVVVLLLFGAEKLPALARSLGQALNEMRRAASDLTQTIMDKDPLAPSARNSITDKRQGIEETQRED